ncbi:MAG: RdgB/HAM1 family non-canonical purine NTP pyrophosphatase [Kiritimatiellaeota bacterium]|nr:RdgB/HAM1 family non-canonical purine NTP pyrophosphatase [Kiritimatiellota bacterium]
MEISRHNETRFLAATGNEHKIREFREILSQFGVEFVHPKDVGGIPEVEENGATFEENAVIKAKSAAETAGMPAFADDSGLVVDILDGAPGIYSSRYADTDTARIARLLREIREKEREAGLRRRAAKFVCVIAVAYPDREDADVFRGEVSGEIIDEPRGENGFGYDPVFVPDGHSATFAELPSEMKDSISHRHNALMAASVHFERVRRDASDVLR